MTFFFKASWWLEGKNPSSLPQSAGKWWHAEKELKILAMFHPHNPHSHPFLAPSRWASGLRSLYFLLSASSVFQFTSFLRLPPEGIAALWGVFIPIWPYMETDVCCSFKRLPDARQRLITNLPVFDWWSNLKACNYPLMNKLGRGVNKEALQLDLSAWVHDIFLNIEFPVYSQHFLFADQTLITAELKSKTKPAQTNREILLSLSSIFTNIQFCI